MPRPPTHKTPKPTKHSEPHTVTIPDVESYTNLTAEEPYIYLQRVLPQYVLAAFLQKQHQERKNFVRVLFPKEILNASYQNNPALFAAIIRRQQCCPFKWVTARVQPDGMVRVTASQNQPQKSSSYLGSCVATMLGIKAKAENEHGVGSGFTVKYQFEGMPRAYANDPNVFRYRVQQNIRKLLLPGVDCDVTLTLRHGEGGYLLSRVPTTNKLPATQNKS